jgi:hypothetical protein
MSIPSGSVPTVEVPSGSVPTVEVGTKPDGIDMLRCHYD